MNEFPRDSIRHTSEELTFVCEKIISCLSENKEHTKKVLLCGRLRELEPCLASLGNRPELLEHIIVATNNITRLYNDKTTVKKPLIVEWDESVYEEYLIERVKTSSDHFSISLAIDFSPTLRRIERIRKLLEKDGVLIITAENPGWRMAKPQLLSSFSANGGSLIKLAECLVSAANSERRLHLLRPVERRNGILGSVSCPEDTRFGGMKGR
ncbi:unnamed protein product [Dibothriocephalus latus]|uniref:Uncharacterized protein n=1 Tax=Dibothriocephalus latus TaxID=60516 RepID=A0A3P7LY79_DIBLA|nr:unnamed protein product [Dibothriocephalus latus]